MRSISTQWAFSWRIVACAVIVMLAATRDLDYGLYEGAQSSFRYAALVLQLHPAPGPYLEDGALSGGCATPSELELDEAGIFGCGDDGKSHPTLRGSGYEDANIVKLPMTHMPLQISAFYVHSVPTPSPAILTSMIEAPSLALDVLTPPPRRV